MPNFKLPSNNKPVLWILGILVLIIAINTIGSSTTKSPINNTSNSINPLPSTLPSNISPTVSPLTPQMQDQGNKQTSADYSTSQIVADYLRKMPFLTQLPINTDQYYILYDFAKNSIRVRLKGKYTQAQVENSVKSQLQQIGVPNSVSVYYLPPVTSTP